MNTILIISVIILTALTTLFCYKRLSKKKVEDFLLEDKPSDPNIQEPEETNENNETNEPNESNESGETGAANLGEQLIWERAAKAIDRLDNKFVSDNTNEQFNYTDGDEFDLAGKAIDKLNSDAETEYQKRNNELSTCGNKYSNIQPVDPDNLFDPVDTTPIEIFEKFDEVDGKIVLLKEKIITEEEAKKQLLDDINRYPSIPALIETIVNNKKLTEEPQSIETEKPIQKKRGRKPKDYNPFKAITDELRNDPEKALKDIGKILKKEPKVKETMRQKKIKERIEKNTPIAKKAIDDYKTKSYEYTQKMRDEDNKLIEETIIEIKKSVKSDKQKSKKVTPKKTNKVTKPKRTKKSKKEV